MLGGLIVVGTIVAFAALIGIEVVVAGYGVLVLERDPHTIDGHIDASSGATSQKALRVAWPGDSLAAGVGASSPDGSVARQVARRLGRPIDIEVLACRALESAMCSTSNCRCCRARPIWC